jgi:hypothetical protein
VTLDIRGYRGGGKSSLATDFKANNKQNRLKTLSP